MTLGSVGSGLGEGNADTLFKFDLNVERGTVRTCLTSFPAPATLSSRISTPSCSPRQTNRCDVDHLTNHFLELGSSPVFDRWTLVHVGLE